VEEGENKREKRAGAYLFAELNTLIEDKTLACSPWQEKELALCCTSQIPCAHVS
jgi:hypothetical protein